MSTMSQRRMNCLATRNWTTARVSALCTARGRMLLLPDDLSQVMDSSWKVLGSSRLCSSLRSRKLCRRASKLGDIPDKSSRLQSSLGKFLLLWACFGTCRVSHLRRTTLRMVVGSPLKLPSPFVALWKSCYVTPPPTGKTRWRAWHAVADLASRIQHAYMGQCFFLILFQLGCVGRFSFFGILGGPLIGLGCPAPSLQSPSQFLEGIQATGQF